MRDSGKVWTVIVQLLVALLLLVSTGEAAVHTLTNRTLNRNTLAVVDDATASTGLYSFKVDGKELMWQQWFWYRVGSTGGEASLETLGLPKVTSTATSVELTYTKDGVFTFKVRYELTPYATGLYRADLKKTVTITNISSQPLDFHLFEYSDYDVTQLATPEDNVEVVGTRVYQNGTQTFSDEGITVVHESSLPPTSFDIDNNQIYLLPELKDGAPSQFSSPQTAYSYGDDMQFAYQWDLNIPALGSKSFDITDKVYPNLPLTAVKTHVDTVSYNGSANYTITFDNLLNNWSNNTPLTNVKIIDYLPKDTVFTSASNGGIHDPASNTVTWSIPSLAAGAVPQSVQAAVMVNSVKDITNEAILVSDEAFPTRVSDLAVLSNHPPSITTSPVGTAAVDAPYTYQVKGSDVDAGDTLQYSLAAKPAGMSIDSASGLITWTPTLAQVGSHQVSVVVTDSGSLTATQNFSITVIKPNSAPVISSPANNATLCAYSLQIEASDPDGDPLLYSFATPNIPLGMSMSANGLITWTNPSSALVGQVVPVTVQVLDSKWASSQVTINFSVSTSCAGGANFAPAAVDDMYSVAQGATLNIPAPGVLGNDYDVNGNTLTSTVSASPAKGKVTLNSNGSFTYVPNAGVTGSDTFRYRVSDGVAESIATVTINFTTAANQPPAAVGDAYSVNQDATLTVAAPGVLGNDTDADNNSLTAILVSSPANGTLTLNANGSFTYTPNAGFVGADSFSYKASDGTADSSIATVALTVNKVNKAPVAADDYYSVTQDSTLTVAATTGVLKNDSDPNGDGLTAVLVAGPSHGTVTLNDIGSFVYVPSAGYAGADSFTYKANDGALDSAVATVFITVIGKGASTVTITGATSYTYNGTPQGPNTATVTGSTGAVTYSYAGTGATSYPASATRPANAGTYTVTATVAADANYNGASSTVAFTINKAGQTVSFTTAAPANPVIGGTYTPAATATSGLAVAITLDAASTGCSLANGVVTFTGAGTCVLNANQGGNGNYNAAAQAQQSIGIGKGASTVTITGATSYTYNGTPQGPNTATVTGSTGAVTYSYAGTGATSYPASATRPANAGTYTVTATVAADANYNGASSTVAFTINKAGQTVSFTTAAPANPVIGGTYTPAATATSGLAVAITLDAASTGCSLANGVVTFTGAGTCVLNANQGGNGNYNAAAQAQQSIGIGKGASTVTITGATSYTYNGTPQGPNTATVTGSTGAVTYSYAGTGATSYPVSATRPANAGTYTVTATVAADANYNGASSTVAFTINKATPVITWSAPAPVYVGTALGAAQLNAAADLAGTFVYTPAAGTVLNTAGDQTLKADFTPADTDNYNSASASVTLTVNTKTNPVITWANPADIVYGTPLSAAQLNAVADVAGSFSYSPAAGAKLNAGAGQILTATFTPADTAKYNSVSKTVTINVAKATPVITWSAPAPVYVGTALGAAQLNATADVAGTFAYTPAAGTVLDTVGDQTLKADFTPADTDNYNNVTASVNLSVTEAAKTTPTITWPLPAAITYGSELSATQLNATASVPGTFVYTPAAGTVLNAGTQTLLVTFTPDDSTHYTTATASVPLTVNKATAVISLGDLSHTYSGSAKSASAITTPAGLTVNLTYNGNAAAPVTAGNYAVVANIDDANYIGSVTGTMVIAKATPVITWATPAAVTVGTSLSSTQLNAIANVAGVFAYTPAAGTVLNTAGSQTLTAAFTPTDSVNYTSATASITLSVLAGTTNQAPVIISQPVTSAYKDGYYFYQVIASDPNGDPILYSLPTRPSGMTINTTTGIISWRPQERGSYSVTVKASDPSGLSSSQSFKISVVDRPSNSSPRITSSPVTTASVETPYSYDVEATDSNGDVLFYTLSNKPSGMTIDLTTGLINWTPSSSQAGSQYVKVDVVDSKGGKTSQSFYITVSNTTVSNNPPVFTSTPVITAPVKKYYVYDVNAVDPDGDAIKYSLAKKPDGMTINSSTGLVYWYASRSGSFDVSIKATDSKGNSAYQNFTITVGTASGGVSASSVSPCDVTGDGLVTIADIQKIITGRGANDLSLDIDGDGEVTLLDSRRCVTEMQN